ncbi:single-stranded-DNA-specific exonuclease RecJ [Spirochaetota bacterium]
MSWQKKDISSQLVREVSERFGIDLLTSSILVRRDFHKAEEAVFFLEDDARFLRNPFLFSGMEDAVDRILLAVDEEEKVLVFGDRDADGISATALMMESLMSLGLDASFRLPGENEKYGLSREAIDEFAAVYGSLIITVDCGISNHAEVDYANKKGIDVIIVDHHVLQSPEPPPALAVLNPKVEASLYPFKDLSGCGVAYKLAWALRFAKSGLYKQAIALLNVRPVKDAYVVEALAMTNLVELGRVTETIVPEVVELERTRLVPFLKNRQIFVWDGEIQKRLLEKAFGRKAEVHFYDIRPDIGRIIPQAAGASLPRLAELSKIGKYMDKSYSELDVFASLFTSFAIKKTGSRDDSDMDALQLAALSTVADLMPLRDENRIIVKQGLSALNKKPRKGLAELLSRLNLSAKRLNANDTAWQVCPVINAAGRIGKPETAVKMLLAQDSAERAAYADELLAYNQERRRLGSENWDMAYPLACNAMEASKGKYIILGSPDIVRGITGILASRMADTFKVTSVVASFLEDGSAVASVRSARGMNVKGLLEHCSSLFHDYGGHDAAAGFSLDQKSWPDFERMAGQYLSSVEYAETEEALDIDAELPHNYMDPGLAAVVDRLEPYGEANPPLVFSSRKVAVIQADIVGKQEKSHLKLLLDFGKHKWPALWWNSADRYGNDFKEKDYIDAVFNVQKNYWNGQESPQLIILDAKKTE